jgi:hypothetical protein
MLQRGREDFLCGVSCFLSVLCGQKLLTAEFAELNAEIAENELEN